MNHSSGPTPDPGRRAADELRRRLGPKYAVELRYLLVVTTPEAPAPFVCEAGEGTFDLFSDEELLHFVEDCANDAEEALG